ncbi:hypothetical protein Tco_0360585, partial [Tanacetum coccineum]
NSVNSSEPTLSIRPTNVEVPKELPKVSMVNTSLKKLKHHLASFDVVVKERTTPTAIIEGSWGFEHTKACFRDEIISFAVKQHRLESKTFEVKMNQVLIENEQLLEQVISKDIVNILVDSSVNNAPINVQECEKCLKLETELQKDFVEKEIYDKVFKSFTTLEKHYISLECNGCMLSDNRDLCVLDFINNMNACGKSKSVKKNSKRKVWKPTGKVFTNIGYTWTPTGRTFTIVGNVFPLTRITTTTEVPLRKPTDLENGTPKPVVTLVYSRKPRKSKTNILVSKSKVLNSISANKKEPSQSWGSIVFDVPSSSLDECRHSKNIPIVGVPSKNTRAVIQEYVPIMGVPSKNTRAVIQEYVPIMGVPSKNTRAVLQEYVPIMGVPSKNTRAVLP